MGRRRINRSICDRKSLGTKKDCELEIAITKYIFQNHLKNLQNAMSRYIADSEAITVATVSWIIDLFNVKVAKFGEHIPGF